jgi:copper transport protein
MRLRLSLACAAAFALLVPVQATAHPTLVSSSPEAQARLAAPPDEIRLRFTQSVTATSRAIVVLAPDGRVVSGPARRSAGGLVVAAAVSGLEQGSAYTVRWRVTGSDGHSPAGVFIVGIGVDPPPPTEAVGASGTTWQDDVVRWLLFVALAFVLGPLAMWLLVLRGNLPGRLERALYLIATAAAFAVIDIGIAAFVVRASNALQLPFGDFLYGDLTPFAEGTRFGVAFLVMTVGFAVVASLLLVAWILDRPLLRWPAFVLAGLLASGLSLSGHQATEPNANVLSQLADWVHLGAAAIWVGGVATLGLLVWPLAPELRRRAFVGFSRVAVGLVGVLVVAGAYLALVRLPELADLWQTSYGRLLTFKLAIVALALVWGGVHHSVVRPRLEAGGQPRVRASLLGEAAVAVAVLLAAAMLTNASPPAVDDTSPTVARESR